MSNRLYLEKFISKLNATLEQAKDFRILYSEIRNIMSNYSLIVFWPFFEIIFPVPVANLSYSRNYLLDRFGHVLESSLLGLLNILSHFSIPDSSQWIFERIEEIPESSFSFKCCWKRIFISGYFNESWFGMVSLFCFVVRCINCTFFNCQNKLYMHKTQNYLTAVTISFFHHILQANICD